MSTEKSKVDLAGLVRRGLVQLQQGRFFTAYGLDENSLPQLLLPVSLQSKDAPLHVFLRAVSELPEDTEGNFDETSAQAREKKKIAKARLSELVRRRKEWIRVINSFLQEKEDADSSDGKEHYKARNKGATTPAIAKRKNIKEVDHNGTDAQRPTSVQSQAVGNKNSTSTKQVSAIKNEDGEGEGEDDDNEPLLDSKMMGLARKGRLSKTTVAGDASKKVTKRKVSQPPKGKGKSTKATRRPSISKELLDKRRNEVKSEFEAKKKDVLEQVPDEVKRRFRQQGFAKWAKNYLPVLILSPFDVPPGPVRQQWMKMFENCKRQGRLKEMTNLIYWYGASNLKECYSFEVTKNIVAYEVGCKKGYDKIPLRIEKIINSGAALKGRDAELHQGLLALAEDADKDPDERKRGIVGFPEEYELLDEQDIHEVEQDRDEGDSSDDDDDSADESIPMAEPSMEVDQPAASQQNLQPAKLKKHKLKGSANTPSAPKKTPSLSTANDMSAIGEAEMSDIDGDEMDEIDSRDDDDDFKLVGRSEMEAASGNNRKKKKEQSKPKKPVEKKRKETNPDANVSPKKKKQKKQAASTEEGMHSEQQAIDSINSDKPASSKRTREDEESMFANCQAQYLPLVNKWQRAIDEKNVEDLTEILKELISVVDNLSASFFEFHRLNQMMKPKTKELVVGNDAASSLYQELWQKMKSAYKDKKATMPDGFIVKLPTHTKMSGIKEEEKVEAVNLSHGDDHEMQDVEAPVAVAETKSSIEGLQTQRSIPRKRSNDDDSTKQAHTSSSQTGPSETKFQSRPSLSAAAPAAAPKPEKKKFSLGNLMRPKEAAATPELRSSGDDPKPATTTSSSGAKDKANTKKLPDWMTKPPRKDPPCDAIRSFGHEFFIQAAGCLPEDLVNVDGVALELEDAVFHYAMDKSKGAASNDTMSEGYDTDNKNAPWVKPYWKMVHLLVAAISGKHDKGGLCPLLLNGNYASAAEVVNIPESNLRRAFENLPLLNHVRD